MKTLRKHFTMELERGRIEANCQVAQTLFDLATSGVCVAATIFWAKTRMGFQEIHVVESRARLRFLISWWRKMWQRKIRRPREDTAQAAPMGVCSSAENAFEFW